MARTATGSDDECDAFLFWLWCRAENVYFGDGVWFAIGNIASELVKSRTFDGKRLKILYDQALLQANSQANIPDLRNESLIWIGDASR